MKNYYLVTVQKSFIAAGGEVDEGGIEKRVESYPENKDPYKNLRMGVLYVEDDESEGIDWKVSDEDDYPSNEDGYNVSIDEYMFKKLTEKQYYIMDDIIQRYNKL